MDGFTYLKKLEEAYTAAGLREDWDHLMQAAEGITAEQRAELIRLYPGIPEELLQILSRVDGTYYREYQGEEFRFYFFGSDVEDGLYPYYLHSFADITEKPDVLDDVPVLEWRREHPDDDLLFIDSRIQTDPARMKWMCFSHCMNNGGTSQLFIDFTPSETGKVGQIVRYLDDDDALRVIADSFAEFLDLQMKFGMEFVGPAD